MKRSIVVLLITAGVVGGIVGVPLLPQAHAAEYRGQNLDGRRFAAKAYSYETGGVFDIQVEFNRKRATMYFVNGGHKTLRLKRSEIKDPKNIVGWSVGIINIGGVFGIGISNSETGNREPPRPRPFEGLWRIMLNDNAIQGNSES